MPQLYLQQTTGEKSVCRIHPCFSFSPASVWESPYQTSGMMKVDIDKLRTLVRFLSINIEIPSCPRVRITDNLCKLTPFKNMYAIETKAMNFPRDKLVSKFV